jgi:hypothetical protein
MGTILAISSHSPYATEVAPGDWLLLFRPAAFLPPKRDSGNPGLSGITCYSITFKLSFLPILRRDFRDEVSFRHITLSPLRESQSFSVHFGAEALCSLKPCDSISERTFPVFIDLLNIHEPGSFCSDFGSRDAQTRRSE